MEVSSHTWQLAATSTIKLSWRMVKGILWDNDGVLSDTEHLFYEVNRALFAEHGVDLSEERYIDWFLVSNCGAWHLLEERGYSNSQLAMLRLERNSRYGEMLAAARGLTRRELFPLLQSLRKTARMAIVTASFREHLELAHNDLTFFQHFETIITREDSGRPKPAPDCYLAALKRMKMDADQCIAIEDSPRGLAAARAAGLKCIILRSPILDQYQFQGALEVVSSVTELREALTRI